MGLWSPAIAQERKNNIESVKAAFITQKLELTPEESQKFWPVYNSYQQELKKLVLIKNSQRRALKENPASAPVDELEIDSEILELRKRYRQEFAKVLPRQKAALVYPAEREFRQQLIEQLQKRKKKN
jgi:Spy/CpxP family protein refolding chaperone